MNPRPTESREFLRHWWRCLHSASLAYWSLQAATVLGLLALIVLLIDPFGADASPVAGQLAARAALDVLLFFGFTHAGLRPLLRWRFAQGTFATRDVAWLALRLMALAAISVAIGAVADQLGPAAMDAVRFESDGTALALRGASVRWLAWFNLCMSYALWSGLYLGYKSYEARRRLQAQVQQARLAQLVHQLSPHFLFNAFNSIRALVFEDPNRAAELITQLSELFRFHLQAETPARQTLAEEWTLAQRYLAIEAVRLEDRLSVDADLAPECLPMRLPALALLSLVENAIKHGIAPEPAGGRLSISAARNSAGWYLEVANTLGARSGTVGAGTGLANLRERLQLGFGPDARLHVAADANLYRARLQLPTDTGAAAGARIRSVAAAQKEPAQ